MIQTDLVYDIGLHKGDDTKYYLDRGYKVIGIEADPDLIEICKNRFQLEISEGRLIIIGGAIVKKDLEFEEFVTFYKNKSNSVWGTIDPYWSKRNELRGCPSIEIKVKTINLCDIINQYGVPYYMKIDIEGSDMECLKYLIDLEKKPIFISMETTTNNFKNLCQEIDMLELLGYSKYCIVNQGRINMNKEAHISGKFGTELENRWMNKAQLIKKYRRINLYHRLFGGKSYFETNKVLRKIKNIIAQIIGQPIPSWYDTHAKIE